MDNSSASQDNVISRGPFIARHYHKSIGVNSIRVWCELEVNGVPYQPFTQDFECSLGPIQQPAAATLSVESGKERGLYLLRMSAGEPTLTKLSEDPNFKGFWTADGLEYVHEGRAVSVITGESRKLPPYPGRFLCLSPDRRILVSLTYEPPSLDITLHQVDIASGADNPVIVKREDHSWLTDSSHLVPGSLESAHIWQATHISWRKSVDGCYQLTLGEE